MKECQAPGLIGMCCREHDGCFLEFHARAESEEHMLYVLRSDIDKIEGCLCKENVIEIIESRLSGNNSNTLET